MAIITANLQCNLDSTNPASNTGSGNTWYDLSANNIDFTGTGTNRINFAGIQCFDLGTGKYFTGPNNLSSVVDWNTNWTVEIWLNYAGSQLGTFHSPWGTAFSYPTNTGFNVQTYNPLSLSRSYFGYGSGAYEITSNPNPSLEIPRDNTTIHQIVVRKSGTTIQYIVDGVPSYSSTGISNSISLSSDPFYIGYGGFYDPMVGKVAVLRVYDTDLSNADVLQNYNETFTAVNAGKMYLNASLSSSASGAGSTWYDLSGNNYNFTMNSPSLTTPAGGNPGYFTFPLRNYTDPLIVYGEYNGTPALGSNNFTVYAWVKRNSAWSSYTMYRCPIFYNGRDTNNNGFMVGTEAPPTSPTRVQAEASGLFQRYATGDITNDIWQCIAATVDSSNNIQFFINGSPNGSSSYFPITAPADGMWIGQSNNLLTWLGDISIIRFYNSVLTNSEISSLYNYDLDNYINATPPPPTPYSGLVGGRTFGMGFAG